MDYGVTSSGPLSHCRAIIHFNEIANIGYHFEITLNQTLGSSLVKKGRFRHILFTSTKMTDRQTYTQTRISRFALCIQLFQRRRSCTCLFGRRFLLLFLLLDGGAAGGDLWGVDWRRFISGWLLFNVRHDASLVVSQLVDDARHERPFCYVLLCTTPCSICHSCLAANCPFSTVISTNYIALMFSW